MAKGGNAQIAACGLDCRICPLRAVTFRAGAPLTVVELLLRSGTTANEERALRSLLHQRLLCPTCRGGHALHWTEDCHIRKCCIDDRGLEHCSECECFPCRHLNDWAESNPRQADALERLHSMAGSTDLPQEDPSQLSQ